jgi:hypothetical protein
MLTCHTADPKYSGLMQILRRVAVTLSLPYVPCFCGAQVTRSVVSNMAKLVQIGACNPKLLGVRDKTDLSTDKPGD